MTPKSPHKAQSPKSCKICAHAKLIGEQLVCYRNPPGIVVIDGKAINMRATVTNEQACGEYKR